MDEVKSGLTLQMAKAMADRAILDVKNGIVTAGYALRAIRNEKLWKEHGYASFDAFMEICYQKDKSWASNCIRVYEKFGELAGPEQEPRLQAKYQEYSAGGLIEMLSMPEELREQVTADMPVREIRELKREARKVATSEPETDPEGEQLEGQMEIYDFPEFMPEPEEWEEKDGWTARETGGSDVIHVTELADDMDQWDGQDEEPAAERQPEPDPNTSCPPGISSCTREHWGTSDAEQEKGRKECRACWKRWRELGEPMKPLAFWRKQEERQGEEQEKESTAGILPEEKVAMSEPKEQPESQWPKTCITGWSKYGNCVCCGVGGVECCASCQELCNSRCGWIPEETEGQKEGPEDQEKKPDTEEKQEEEPEGQQETVQRKISTEGLLEKYERELAEMQEVFQDTPKENWPLVVEKTQILVVALRLLAEQEKKQQKEPEPLVKEHPELPIMRNNDQRKEWMRNYQDWGLWYEDEHIGVRYYKYEFDNGAQLIAEEYPAAGKRDFTTYYLHLVGGPEPPKHPSYGCPRWSRHARYDKHPDSETELIEFLKAVQR